ncbi:hypothetical protein AAG906_030220 [Vitis piasezkii]
MEENGEKERVFFSENLPSIPIETLFSDLLDYEGLCAAFAGCSGVFHVVSPVPIGPNFTHFELIELDITGTHNLPKECERAKVKKVVVLSSAELLLPCKTIADSQSLEDAKKSELNIATVCPSFVFGPMLQSTMNGCSLTFMKVCDVAEVILLAYKNPDAVGRYIC